MSHKETRQEVDEWEVDVCDNCNHEKSHHWINPVEVKEYGQNWWWEGCDIIVPLHKGSYLRGNNPYPRCKCMKFA